MSDTTVAARPAPRRSTTPRRQVLGRILTDRFGLAEDELRAALDLQADSGRRLGEILVERGAVEEEGVARALAMQLALEYRSPPLEVDPNLARSLGERFCRERRAIPLELDGRILVLGHPDPLDGDAVEDARFRSGRPVRAVVVSPQAVDEALDRCFGDRLADLVDGLRVRETDHHGRESESLERAARAAPIVRLLDRLLADAVARRASDLHLEPAATGLVVRFRVDGILREHTTVPAVAAAPLLSRVKIVAGLDISVKRRPQDGSFTLDEAGRQLRVRASTLPVTGGLGGGEKGVLRLLDPDRGPAGLDELGLGPEELRRVRRLLGVRHGVVLATGPTGSGKSSTLFAALREMDRERLNVLTLEDPVEFRLAGASQVEVDRRAGRGFPEALRAALRQDPDVIMVGEIRDRETAEIAMAAAVTGHLVLSTLHTTDAPGAVSRLLQMGVPPFLVAGGLSGVVAQRLVRTLCSRCGGRSSEGCTACPDGYSGRTGVFQVLTVTDRMREEVAGAGSAETLRRLAGEAGMRTLGEDARRLVSEGRTTPHEIGRVIATDPGGPLACSRCGEGVPLGARGCPGCGHPRFRSCACGSRIRRGWRFCPDCLKPVIAA